MSAAFNRRRLLLLIILRRRNERRRKPRFWMRQIYKDRKEKGEFHMLVREAKLFDQEMFF